MKNLTERICIIGGGPAGLSAAMYLEKKGYKNYVIYEKDDHVGGKCHSPAYNGKHYEMGAIMGVPSYYAVRDAEMFCGGLKEDGPFLAKEYKKTNGKLYEPFNPKNILQLPGLLKLKKQIKRLGELLETKYKGYDVNGYRSLAQGKYDGYAVSSNLTHITGDNPNLKDLCLPFKEFCRINKIELTQRVWIGPFTAFGYGYFDEIPAAYVLKYLDFQTTMSFVKGKTFTWEDGTQSIWINLNDHLAHPAIINSNISKVTRVADKVIVSVNGKDESFDKIIITAPLQYMDKYFDATQEEKDLFAKIDYERYDVQACLLKKGHYPKRSCYIFDNMVPERLGELMIYYVRWEGEEDQVVTTYVLRNHKDVAEIPYETAKAKALAEMQVCGADVEKVIYEKSWYYFPHVFSKDMAAGWYDKVEALQGQKNTFYAGEVMSYGDMDETAEYSKELVERFF